MVLNDKNIRHFLKSRLQNSNVLAIKEELRIVHNRAIADIVTLGQILHCYEIKGDTDSLSRIKNQIFYYNQTFDKITVVVTERKKNTVKSIIPDFWGIILATAVENRISFTYLRAAKKNPQLEKYNILFSLWKNELGNILNLENEKNTEKISRSALVKRMSDFSTNKKILNIAFSKQIIQREQRGLSIDN